MIQTLWEERDSKSVKIDKIMHLVDALVDKQCELVRLRGKAEDNGEELLGIYHQDKLDAIKLTNRRIWDALEKL